jgi:hypothetical protein
MKKLLTVLLAGTSFCAVAQKVSKPDAYAKTITTEDLKKHLYIIASPEMEGRETGTEGQRKAAAYIETYFKNIGLQPGNGSSYQQYYSLYQDSVVSAVIEVNGKTYEIDKDFTVGATNMQATMKLSEVVVVSAGTAASDAFKNTEIGGKLVMVLGNVNQSLYAQLSKKLPAGFLTLGTDFPKKTASTRISRQSIRGFRSTITPATFTLSESLARAITGSRYDSVKLSTTMVHIAKADVMLDVKKTTITAEASNVLGLLPGTDLKDEYVVISAHYDHLGKRNGVVYPGADDDGSGTVGVLELAEAFVKASKEGKGPRRSILFLANSGEEKGLWGSEYYTDHPVYPLEKTTVNLNIDMIGRSDPDRKPDTLNYIYVVGDDKISTDLKTISEAQNKRYTKIDLDYKYNDPNDKERIYYRSDHYNFAKNGVPIIFYYDGMLRPDYHRPTDTPDKINYSLMQRRTQLVFYTGWEMANRDAMLKRDIPLNTPPR